VNAFSTLAKTLLTWPVDAYLGAHYELLREDALRSLREAICQIRKDPQANEDAFKNSVGIYQDVSPHCHQNRSLNG